MGFFSDLKQDLSQAVNELMPDSAPEELLDAKSDDLVQDLTEDKVQKNTNAESNDTVDFESFDLSSMLDKLDDITIADAEAEDTADRMVGITGESTDANFAGAGEEINLSDLIASFSAEESLTGVSVEDDAIPEEKKETVSDSSEEDSSWKTIDDILAEDLLANLSEATLEVPADNASDIPLDAAISEDGFSYDEPVMEEIPVDEPVMGEIPVDEPVIEEIPVDEPVMEDVIIPETAEEIPEVEKIPMEAATIEEVPIQEIPIQEIPIAESVIGEVTVADTVSVAETATEGIAETQEEEYVYEIIKGVERTMDGQNRVAVDETAVVTAGMSINGDIASEGSLELIGSVTGNIDVLGKLNVTGCIQGNSKAEEIYAEGARIIGEINSLGSVKIGQSSVIIGNISATSAVIAGAVKGDIDVHGPVILDTSAIVMGNIKSKSVQINNGAVIEGMCSQCYADVNPSSFFEDFKKKQ